MMETQTSVTEWADATFGTKQSNLSIATRANQEMAELLMCLTKDDRSPHAVEECADIVIVLMRLVDRAGCSLGEAIDAKMAINRQRVWRLDGHGHGYHVPSRREEEFRDSLDRAP